MFGPLVGDIRDEIGDVGKKCIQPHSHSGRLRKSIKLLITSQADIEYRDEHSIHQGSCLRAATMQGDVDIAEVLLRARAVVDSADQGGKTSLHLAALKGYTDILNLLLENTASAESVDRWGRTALHERRRKGIFNAWSNC